jgi:hypothetical protein
MKVELIILIKNEGAQTRASKCEKDTERVYARAATGAVPASEAKKEELRETKQGRATGAPLGARDSKGAKWNSAARRSLTHFKD